MMRLLFTHQYQIIVSDDKIFLMCYVGHVRLTNRIINKIILLPLIFHRILRVETVVLRRMLCAKACMHASSTQ